MSEIKSKRLDMINRKQFLQRMGGTAAAMTVAPFLNLENSEAVAKDLKQYSGSPDEI
ncbi:MAG: hypothetical protein GVY20_09700, partial [Bacteroidetes bacterium]|nr:hypothetical protein [Bacteroidota bacterium]